MRLKKRKYKSWCQREATIWYGDKPNSKGVIRCTRCGRRLRLGFRIPCEFGVYWHGSLDYMLPPHKTKLR
jgi:hypothetical protein